MNLSQLSLIFKSFSDVDLISFTKNTLANANQLFVVTTAGNQKYVIKLLKTQSLDSVEAEIAIQERLDTVGVTCPRYLQLKNGKKIGSYDEHFFVLYRYIRGDRAKKVTLQYADEFGVIMAKLHQATEGVTIPENHAQWLNLKNAQEDLSRYSGPIKGTISKLLRDNSYLLTSGLPRTIVHGDLTLSNVLTSQGKIVTIFDFETAEDTIRILDIARTYLSLIRTIDQSKQTVLKHLINGYNSATSTPLTEPEERHLQAAIHFTAAACAAWCVNNDQLSSAEIYMQCIDVVN